MSDELLEALLEESREHLDTIEPDLLEMEQLGDGVSDELINRVFRGMHSIKGGFGFFGFAKLVSLAHVMENVLMKVRDKELGIAPNITEALLQGTDKLATMIDDPSSSEEVPVDEEMAALNAILAGQEAPAAEPEAQGAAPTQAKATGLTSSILQDNKEDILAEISTGLHVHSIVCQKKRETEASIIKELSDSGKVVAITEQEDTFEIIYSTVLDPDLVEVGMPTPVVKVVTLSPEDLEASAESAPEQSEEKAPQTPAPKPVAKAPAASKKSDPNPPKLQLPPAINPTRASV